ncbi:MAG: hypothetical protein AB9834_22975 [Lentimicrobium sp.]
MKVFVNNTEVRVFTGANAGDAVLAYCRLIYLNIPDPLPPVFDRFGNQVEKDGALSPDIHLYILIPENTFSHE